VLCALKESGVRVVCSVVEMPVMLENFAIRRSDSERRGGCAMALS
jgi:hypothetical protein